MIDELPAPRTDDPYAQHLELMRLLINMNTGAAKASVRPVIDGSAEGTAGQVKIFGVALADALRCYAEGVVQEHGLDPERVIRSVVTAMRCELAEPTGGGIAVQVDDDLALPGDAGEDLAGRAMRGSRGQIDE